QHLKAYSEQDEKARLANPVFHIHGGKVPDKSIPVSFNLLLNLASACNPEDKSVLWGFISAHAERANPETMPELDILVKRALRYYDDVIKPTKQYRAPTDKERAAMEDLAKRLQSFENPESGTQ